MSDQDDLPTVFAQGTDQNERIASLLSSVFFRGIRPSFTHAIQRHPLSMWSLDSSNEDYYNNNRQGNPKKQMPLVIFLESSSCHNYMRIISSVLKKSVVESGLTVAEHIICSQDDHVDIFGSFSPEATIFVIDLCSGISLFHSQRGGERSCIKGIISLDPKDGSSSLSTTRSGPPQLVLVSKQLGNAVNSYSPTIQCHLHDPYTTAVALPQSLNRYGDDGANSLWLARTVLKWMKAVEQTSNSSSPTTTTNFERSRL